MGGWGKPLYQPPMPLNYPKQASLPIHHAPDLHPKQPLLPPPTHTPLAHRVKKSLPLPPPRPPPPKRRRLQVVVVVVAVGSRVKNGKMLSC